MLIEIQRREARRNTRYRLLAKTTADRAVMESALSDLESILRRKRSSRGGSRSESALLAACRLVGKAMGIEVHEDPL